MMWVWWCEHDDFDIMLWMSCRETAAFCESICIYCIHRNCNALSWECWQCFTKTKFIYLSGMNACISGPPEECGYTRIRFAHNSWIFCVWNCAEARTKVRKTVHRFLLNMLYLLHPKNSCCWSSTASPWNSPMSAKMYLLTKAFTHLPQAAGWQSFLRSLDGWEFAAEDEFWKGGTHGSFLTSQISAWSNESQYKWCIRL